jgi:formylmethanofuran:tetrahydromethanopterin formyltransferase
MKVTKIFQSTVLCCAAASSGLIAANSKIDAQASLTGVMTSFNVVLTLAGTLAESGGPSIVAFTKPVDGGELFLGVVLRKLISGG